MRARISRISYRIDTSDLLKLEISLNALGSELSKLDRKGASLEVPKFRRNATRKINGMIQALALNVAQSAYENTPIGDQGKLEDGMQAGASRRAASYARLYANRMVDYGINMQTGYHAGAYTYSEVKNPSFIPEIRTYSEMMTSITTSFRSSYQIGDVFYIAAQGPAYKFMQAGDLPSAPDGLVKPTMQQILSSYKIDMMTAYNKKY